MLYNTKNVFSVHPLPHVPLRLLIKLVLFPASSVYKANSEVTLNVRVHYTYSYHGKQFTYIYMHVTVPLKSDRIATKFDKKIHQN